jgi:hypothetical protein
MVAAALLNACGLLDIQPQNAIIPRTLEDYQSILAGGYPTTDFFSALTYLSDDVYINPNGTSKPNDANMRFFTWAQSHEVANAPSDPMWGALYKSIYVANTVLDALGGMSPSNAQRELHETLVGEAHALRAWAYFYLASIYADVYSQANADMPCVPMPLTADDVNAVARNNVREPIGKVWGQIAADLETASQYLTGKPSKGEYRFSFISTRALQARVCLYMERWDDAIAAATDVIGGSALFDMNILQTRVDNTPRGNRYVFTDIYGFMDSDYRKEVLLFLGGKGNGNPFYFWTAQSKPAPAIADLCMRFQPEYAGGARPSTADELNMMDVVDYRAYMFCSFADYMNTNDDMPIGPTWYHMYGFQAPRQEYNIALKASEAYVIRAEASMRKASPDKARAIADLNTLVGKRIRSSAFRPLAAGDFATDAALLARIYEERRLETALEGGLRWFDLRRLGKPALTHVVPNADPFELAQGDLRYVLQIPESEQTASPNMPENPR